MKFSVSIYSFGHLLNTLGIYGLIDKASEMGFDGIEFVDYAIAESSDEELSSICSYANQKGISITALCVGADLWYRNEKQREAATARLHSFVDKAKLLGASILRHDIASQPRNRSFSIGYDDCIEAVYEIIRENAEYASKQGVVVVTENHGTFSQDADRIEKLINRVAHPNFGVLVDVGNFMMADEDPCISVGKLAPYARYVHVKDFFFKSGAEYEPLEGWMGTRAGNFIRPTIIGHGDAHVLQSLKVLRESGYDGFVSIEFEGAEDTLSSIAEGLSYMKKYL